MKKKENECQYRMLQPILDLFKKNGGKREHMIYECSIESDVEILGHVFHGLTDIQERVEMCLYDGKDCEIREVKSKKSGPIHVGELWMRYPCFDSSDFLYENRSYQNYIFRNHPIWKREMRSLEELPGFCDARRLDDSVPVDMLPMVYYRGDGNTMLVGI